MDFWIPLVLQEDTNILPKDLPGANYSECICPKCSETVIHHVGVPCRHHSCPKCGGLLERRGEHDLEIKESRAIKQSELKQEVPIKGKFVVISPTGESISLDSYLTLIQSGSYNKEKIILPEDYLQTFRKSGQKVKKNVLSPR